MNCDVTSTRSQHCWRNWDNKGGKKNLYLHTNVCIISRASKGNRIRQENRISILCMLTGRNVILLNAKCVWYFLEKDIVPDTLDPAWAKQEKGELKRCLGSGGDNIGRENIAFCMTAFTWTRNRKMTSISADQDDWILFVYARKGWNSRFNKPGLQEFFPFPHTLPEALWKGLQPEELCLSFSVFYPSPFDLLPSPMRQRWQLPTIRHVPDFTCSVIQALPRSNSTGIF